MSVTGATRLVKSTFRLDERLGQQSINAKYCQHRAEAESSAFEAGKHAVGSRRQAVNNQQPQAEAGGCAGIQIRSTSKFSQQIVPTVLSFQHQFNHFSQRAAAAPALVT